MRLSRITIVNCSKMPRAFLSHSSDDKDFVGAVAGRLGRHRVAFDAMHFKSGNNFVSEIEKYVNTSDVFVFFASPRSLNSYWCKLEIDTARLALIQGLLRRSLTYVISNTVSINDLPEWLRQTKVMSKPGVGRVVRSIDHHLMSLIPSDQRLPFVGRNALKNWFLEGLAGPSKRKVFVFSGLEAMGRRSYAKNVLAENLALQPGPIVNFDPLIGLEEIYAQLLTENESHSAASLGTQMNAFGSLTVEQQLDEVAGKLDTVTGTDEYPVFVDHNGLTDKHRMFIDVFDKLMDRFLNRSNDRYLVLIHRGKPKFEQSSVGSMAMHQHVNPLTRAESAGLLRRLLAGSVMVDESQLQQSAVASEGYPPAIFFIAKYIEKYGVELLLKSTEDIAALKRGVFVKFLQSLILDPIWIRLLRYLALEGSLQYGVIAEGLAIGEDELAKALRALIDVSLVTYDGSHYAISWPIRDSVIRVWGELSESEYKLIAKNLAAMTCRTKEIPDLGTINAILAAQVRGKMAADWEQLDIPLLPSSMARLCEQCYFYKRYQKAYDISILAVKHAKTRGQRLLALSIQAKSLVNMQRWDDASAVIDKLDDEVARERFYLRGFMLKKRRCYVEALAEFEKALETNHSSNSVMRDSADCLFRLGMFKEAIQRISIARERDPDNPWVLDLLARCYTDANDEVGFNDAIKDLKASDPEGRFCFHREAVFLTKKGKLSEAMDLAERACKITRPPFECFALRASIAIEMHSFNLAKKYLTDIQDKFGTTYSDIQNSLLCKYHLAQGKWDEATSFWDKLKEKDLREAQLLEINILEAKGNDKSLTLTDRQAAVSRAESMKLDVGQSTALLGDERSEEEGV